MKGILPRFVVEGAELPGPLRVGVRAVAENAEVLRVRWLDSGKLLLGAAQPFPGEADYKVHKSSNSAAEVTTPVNVLVTPNFAERFILARSPWRGYPNPESMMFPVYGTQNAQFRIESTSDLKVWQSVTNGIFPFDEMTIITVPSMAGEHQFYRAVLE